MNFPRDFLQISPRFPHTYMIDIVFHVNGIRDRYRGSIVLTRVLYDGNNLLIRFSDVISEMIERAEKNR